MAVLKLRMVWEQLRSSFWFLPGVIVLAAVVLALSLVQLDMSLQEKQALYAEWPMLLGSGAEGARSLLSTVASSMITVAGVVFSITIVALSLASNQYTSRVLRNFMRDRINQAVLGLFVGIFAYCLMVLRTIRGAEETVFVPSLAVLFGLLLAFVGIAVLIYFIHHIAVSIQAVNILAEVAVESLGAVERLFPDRLQLPEQEESSAPLDPAAVWSPVPAAANGYLQSFDTAGILAFGRRHDALVRVRIAVGDFAVAGTPLAWVTAPALENEQIRELAACFAIGRQRTVEQDLGFGIRQIVDVALKALSPGINDTTTAVMSIHYLTAILYRLDDRHISSRHYDEDGALRLLSCGPSYQRFVTDAFDQIRQSAAGNVAIFDALLDALDLLAQRAASPGRREVLVEQLEMVAELAHRTVETARDRLRLDGRSAAMLESLRRKSDG
jgi:uncharacterized membrane protein